MEETRGQRKWRKTSHFLVHLHDKRAFPLILISRAQNYISLLQKVLFVFDLFIVQQELLAVDSFL
jgi:hypothetical protein